MREKAARKKRRVIVSRLQWIIGGTVAAFILGGSLWAWRSGWAEKQVNAGVESVYQFTARRGFVLQSLYLEGRNRTPMKDIEEALGVKKGDPIFRLSIHDVRERLEAIESVRFAAVERELPGTLIIRIIEREPVALWQKGGRIALVDDNGVVMTGLDIKPYRHLPLIVGEEAPKHIAELMTILALEPDLAKRFSSAIWVGERRWNIRLAPGIEVKLPQKDPAAAWKKLAELHATQKLLDRDVKVIDLRVEGRLFIKLSPEDMPNKIAGAKET